MCDKGEGKQPEVLERLPVSTHILPYPTLPYPSLGSGARQTDRRHPTKDMQWPCKKDAHTARTTRWWQSPAGALACLGSGRAR